MARTAKQPYMYFCDTSDGGFVLKAEQKEAVESLLRGKDVFGVLPSGFGKGLIFQLFVLVKNRASSSPNASVEQ